jgi:hypothetical protein
VEEGLLLSCYAWLTSQITSLVAREWQTMVDESKMVDGPDPYAAKDFGHVLGQDSFFFFLFVWVNWIYAIEIFTDWRYAITKTIVGNMPHQLPHSWYDESISMPRAHSALLHWYIHLTRPASGNGLTTGPPAQPNLTR